MNHTDTGSGTPIVWIHGFPLSAAAWRDQLGIEGARHIVPDLPGFGGTPFDGGTMTMDDYARACVSLLDAKGIDRAVFAGVSMGGYICLAIARLFPERLKALILVDTRELADSDEAKQGRFDSIEKVRANGIGSVVDAMLPKMTTADAPQELRDRVRTIMQSATPEGVIAALQAMAGRPDSSEVAKEIAVPVLVIVGDSDVITPPADAQRMTALIPGAKLVTMVRAGHLSQMERPAEFNAAVEQFLRELE